MSVERFVMSAAVDRVADWWGIKHEDMARIIGEYSDDDEDTFNRRAALVVGLTVGLGDLFGNDRDAERDWIWKKHPGLDGSSPLNEMLGSRSGLPAVVDLLSVARNLR